MRCPCDYNAMPTMGLIVAIAGLVKFLDGAGWGVIIFLAGWCLCCVGDHLRERDKPR